MSARARAQASHAEPLAGSVDLSFDRPAGEPSLTEDQGLVAAMRACTRRTSCASGALTARCAGPRRAGHAARGGRDPARGDARAVEAPPSAASATLAKDTLALQRSLARLEHEQRLQAARLEDRPF